MERSTLTKQIVVQALFLTLFLAGIWAIVESQKKTPPGADGKAAKQASAGPRGGRPPMGRGAPGGRRTTTARPSVPVVITPVARKPIDAFLLSTCNLEARVEVLVPARIAEEVKEILVEEGDKVKQGQALARLNDAEVALREKQQKMQLTKAKSDLDRLQRMYKNNIVSDEAMEATQVAYENALVNHENAKLTLSYTRVLSPVAGVVVERSVDAGQHVKSNEVLFKIANYDPIWGRIHVPERDLSKISVGLPVKVKVDSVPGKDFVGKVSLISPVVDSDTGTVKVTFEIPEPHKHGLRPGMFASTYLITETHKDAKVLPKKSLIIESDVNEVFVVKDFLAAKVSAEHKDLIKVGAKVKVSASAAETKAQGGGDPPRPDRIAAEGKPKPAERVVIDTTFHSVPEPDEDATEMEVLVSLPDGHSLKSDMDVKLKIAAPPVEGSKDAKTLTLHTKEAAVRNLAMKRPVKVGFSEGNEIEVLSGVEIGERVVAVGHEDLKQGAAVTVIGTEGEGKVHVAKPAAKPKAPAAMPMPPAFVIDRMRQRVLGDPKVKVEYDARVKKDPAIETDAAKFWQFVTEMREKGLIKSRRRGSGRPGGHGR